MCRSLTSIIIPSTVEHIGSLSFVYCISLSNISCPAIYIGDYAFTYCAGLESAAFTALDADSVQHLITNYGIFENANIDLETWEPYDKTIHITCSDGEFDAVLYADGTIEFIDT